MCGYFLLLPAPVVADPQLEWLGPSKGVIHLATAAIANAIWDMFAKARGKPLWKLLVDMTPEEFVSTVSFKYITDAITKEEALALLKKNEAGKKAREEEVIKRGYPAYTTSVGWLGEFFSLHQLSQRSSSVQSPPLLPSADHLSPFMCYRLLG